MKDDAQTRRLVERIPLMVSSQELTEIEDFRFANRINTRAEAVRRLIARGLKDTGAASVQL